MTPIQPILIAALIAAGVAHLKSFGSRLVSRAVTLAFVLLGVAFVIQPELTNRLAHMVGVGRGADLVLYALFPASVSLFLHLYRRHRRLEEKLTSLARAVALHNARRFGGPAASPSVDPGHDG
jgi:hypothetical protein